MIKVRFRLFLLIVVLFAAGLACDLSGTPAGQVPTADEESAVQTMVVVTLTAHAAEQAAGEPVIVTLQPTSEPEIPFVPPRALQVAYIKDGNVYVWTEGESSVGLTSSRDAVMVEISDDGTMIAYLRKDPNLPYSNELWVVNTRGGTNARPLVSSQELLDLKAGSPNPETPGGLGVLSFTWRPQSHQLAYSTYDGGGYGPYWDMRLVNVDTLEKKTLFDFGEGGGFYYSPDARYIAISNPEDIDLYKADGTLIGENVLTFERVITYSEYNFRPSLVWAPDSQSLRVAIPPHDPMDESGPSSTALWSIPVDGTPPVRLAEIKAAPFDWMENAFAPGLDKIAYVKEVGQPEENRRELHLAQVDGGGDYVFAVGISLSFLTWVPGGERFVFQFGGGDGRGIYRGSVTGETEIITSAPEAVQQMRWVDSSRFLYLQKKQNSNDWELRISDTDGTNHAFIATLPDDRLSFDFTQ